jgi:hypothetical protein
VEWRGLEPRSLLCKSSVRPLNHHPENRRAKSCAWVRGWECPAGFAPAPPSGPVGRRSLSSSGYDNPVRTARWHDVKDSNPLDGSFGGSPVTVTYAVCFVLLSFPAAPFILYHPAALSIFYLLSRFLLIVAGGA